MAIAYNAKIPHLKDALVFYDVKNPKCYSGSGESFNNLISSTTHTGATRLGDANYYSISDGVVNVSSTGSSTTTGAAIVGTGAIASTTNFDFTTSGWLYRTNNNSGEVMSYRQTWTRLSFDITNSGMLFHQREVEDPYTTNTTSVSVTNALNEWACFSLVKSGNYWSFYKNGELVGGNSFTMTETISDSGSGYHHIGIAWSDDDYMSTAMNGKIGPVIHYTRALTASEIKELFNAHRGRFGV